MAGTYLPGIEPADDAVAVEGRPAVASTTRGRPMRASLSSFDSTNSRARVTEQEKKDEEKRRQEDLDFERSVCISVLRVEDFYDVLGCEWMKRPPTKMDLSGSRFKLETLEGPSKGLLNPTLKKHRLTYLDVSDNRLHDINCISKVHGFEALTCLLAKRNLIGSALLQLPKLIELNLAHNQLTMLPPLDKIPYLEVLMLSHNQLSGSLEGLTAGPRIKRLDLAYNQYDFSPTQFDTALKHMAKLKSLHEVRLYNNPFVACFKEYQVFVLKALPNLRVLDDLDMTSYSREDMTSYIKQTGIRELPVYDDAYRKRKEKERYAQENNKAEDGSAAAFASEGGLPRLKNIVVLLQEVIDDVSVLQKNVQLVRSIAMRRARHLKALNEMGDIFWEDIVEDEQSKAHCTDKDYEAAVSRTMELIVLVMERHDSVRGTIIETLGWLTSVVEHEFCYKCLHRLGHLMMSSSEDKAMVLNTLETIVVPLIKSMATSDGEGLKGKRARVLINGIGMLLGHKSLRAEVAKVLRHVIPMLLEWLKSSEKAQDLQDGEHVIHALARLTDEKDNCLLVASLPVARKCVAAINNQSYALSDKYCNLWLDFLHLAENLIKYSDQDSPVPQTFQDDSVHVTVISRGRAIQAENDRESTQHMTMVARILRFLAVMMKRMQQVLLDSCQSYHFTDFLCHLLKDTTDPMVLAEGCACLLVVLENPVMYKMKGKHVVDELMKLTPFLTFLGAGDQRYADLYSAAVHHSKPKGSKYQLVEPPPLQHLDDPLVCAALCSIIALLAFFADESGPHDDLREMVNHELDKNHKRDQKLLRLLVVQSDDVRLSVMNCIGQVETDDIGSEEMGMIVKCLSDTRNISEGETEVVLAHVMKLLEKLVDSNRNEGVLFRQNYAEMAIAESYLILHQNAMRDTYGRIEEEDQKLVLSSSIVSFLRACSHRPALRDHLRAPFIEDVFPELLKKEEELHRPYAKDVAVEQMWTGRSLDNLMKSIAGEKALTRSKKVNFRVLSRMADVIEGVPDFLYGRAEPYSLQDLAEKESGMWNEKRTLRNQLHLDDTELEDLRDQSADIRGKLATIMAHLMNFDRRTELNRVLELTLDEKRWFEEAMRNAESRVKAVANDQDRQAVEDVPKVKLDDPEEEADDELSGDEVLASAIHQYEDVAEDASGHLFTLRPEMFAYNETILFDRVTQGVLPESSTYKSEYYINPALPVAAFLRIVYAALLVPQTEDARRQVISDLRQREVAARIYALVDCVPYLHCNVAAKFLRVMKLVLDTRTSRHFEPPLEILSLMAKYVQRIADGMLSLLKMTKDQCLDIREQTLCSEVASFMTALIASTPPSVNWLGCPITRRETISNCIDHMVPAVIIRLLIAMIIYDLQMDLGGGERERIQKQFVQQAYNKVAMKDNATQAIVRLLVHNPHHKYDVLEVFSVADVFHQQSVRPCYLAELLNDVAMGTYMLYVGDRLRETEKLAKDVNLRLDHMRRVEVACPKGGVAAVQRLLCTTNESLFLFTPPESRPLYANDDELRSGRWQPTWEAVFPRPPIQIWKRSYSQIACLYRCYGSQMMAIEWKSSADSAKAPEQQRHAITGQAPAHGGRAPGQSPNAQPPEGREGKSCGIGAPRSSAQRAADEAAPAARPDFDLVIFQRSNVREDVANTLRKFSAKQVEHRANIVNDASIRREVLEHPEVNDPTGESVLAVSVALAEPKPTSMLEWGARMQKEPLLFVLTLKKVLVFSVSLNAWWPQKLDVGEEYVDMEDFRPKDLFADAPASRGAEQTTGERQETPAVLAKSPSKVGQNHPKSRVLTCNDKQDLSLKEVVFKTSAEAELIMRFKNGSEISIHFYDDTEREHWRRALAYTLFSTQKIWTRDIPTVL